jgi:hypothetical protein
MADYSKMSDADLLAMVKPKADYSKMSDADLLKMVQPQEQPKLSDAVTDIPAEIGRTAGANLDTIKAGVTDRGTKGPIEGLMSTGKALLAVPGLLASPITGAVKSLVGHPMAQAEHAAGNIIAPEIAKNDNPQEMYRNAAGDVETALSAARPGTAVPRVAAPTIPELKAASRAGYNNPEVTAVEIHPQSTAALSARIESDLAQRGFRPNNEAPVFNAVRELNPPPGVQSVRVADIDSARKVLGNIAKERDSVGQATPRATAANVAIDHINDYLPNISAADVIAGDAPRAAQILQDAQSNWGAAKRAENVDLQLTRADRQAAKSGSGSNIENSMRQKIATLLDNPRRTVGFSAPERDAMESIVRGTVTRNTLRKVGKLGVDGGLSLLLHAGTALETGGINLPVAVGGTAARKVGEALTARAGRNLSDMVRSRSALHRGNQGAAAVQQALIGNTPARVTAIPYAGVASGSPSQLRRAQIAQLLAQQGN